MKRFGNFFKSAHRPGHTNIFPRFVAKRGLRHVTRTSRNNNYSVSSDRKARAAAEMADALHNGDESSFSPTTEAPAIPEALAVAPAQKTRAIMMAQQPQASPHSSTPRTTLQDSAAVAPLGTTTASSSSETVAIQGGRATGVAIFKRKIARCCLACLVMCG